MAYELKKTCPPKLSELLEKVNLLPKEQDRLDRFQKVMSALFQEQKPHEDRAVELFNLAENKRTSEAVAKDARKKIDRFTNWFENRFEQVITNCFKDDVQLQNLANYIVTEGGPSTGYLAEEIRSLLAAREVLRKFARAATHGKRSDRLIVLSAPVDEPFVKVLGDWTIELPSYDVVTLFTNERFPINRLLDCPVCRRIVWKKRLDAKTCGEKTCSDTRGNDKRPRKKKEK